MAASIDAVRSPVRLGRPWPCGLGRGDVGRAVDRPGSAPCGSGRRGAEARSPRPRPWGAPWRCPWRPRISRGGTPVTRRDGHAAGLVAEPDRMERHGELARGHHLGLAPAAARRRARDLGAHPPRRSWTSASAVWQGARRTSAHGIDQTALRGSSDRRRGRSRTASSARSRLAPSDATPTGRDVLVRIRYARPRASPLVGLVAEPRGQRHGRVGRVDHRRRRAERAKPPRRPRRGRAGLGRTARLRPAAPARPQPRRARGRSSVGARSVPPRRASESRDPRRGPIGDPRRASSAHPLAGSVAQGGLSIHRARPAGRLPARDRGAGRRRRAAVAVGGAALPGRAAPHTAEARVPARFRNVAFTGVRDGC